MWWICDGAPKATSHEARAVPAPFDELADPRLLVELARVAESRGWDGLFLWDRIAYPPSDRAVGGTQRHRFKTDSLRIGPTITPLSRTRVQKVARSVAGQGHGRFCP
jgi:alkanesulfonate monooxygenase SsuD/methylene tetrahydromethanopterin reductase-like flavin-dependent oxidoreductase (luciferase family)